MPPDKLHAPRDQLKRWFHGFPCLFFVTGYTDAVGLPSVSSGCLLWKFQSYIAPSGNTALEYSRSGPIRTALRRKHAMVTLTEKAAEKVKAVLAVQGSPYSGIRVAVVGGGCSGFQYAMNLETEQREGDQIVQVNGFQVYVDPDSLNHLKGTEIDYVETIQGAGFTFGNPNAK